MKYCILELSMPSIMPKDHKTIPTTNNLIKYSQGMVQPKKYHKHL